MKLRVFGVAVALMGLSLFGWVIEEGANQIHAGTDPILVYLFPALLVPAAVMALGATLAFGWRPKS